MNYRPVIWTLLAMLAVGTLGCVPQARYDKLDKTYRTCQEQTIDLRAELEEAKAMIVTLQGADPVPDPATVKALQDMTADRDRLQTALAKAQDQIRELGEMGGQPLPQGLDDALVKLAAENPELMTYDPATGMIKLQSDLTFASGSAVVGDEAAKGLAKLAAILKQPIAQGYDVQVVGHTDNVKISNPETKKLHPTNWHLSVHRAIAVKDVLEKSGVAAKKLVVAGRGEYQPIAPNTDKGNRLNRRVEIFIVRSAAKGIASD